jgi:hypothetical protein
MLNLLVLVVPVLVAFSPNSSAASSAPSAPQVLVKAPATDGAAPADTSQQGGAPKEIVEAVSARALARWRALIDGDLDTAYAFEAPGFRKAVTLDAFKSRFGGAAVWKAVEVERVELVGDGTAARVVLMVTYEPRLPTGMEFGPMRRPVTEAWLRKSGQWWHVSK